MNASVALRACLDAQRRALLGLPPRSYQERLADLDALGRWVETENEAIAKAISADFGTRSPFETRLAETLTVLGAVRNAKSQLKTWMRPRRRRADWIQYPLARNRIVAQPIGVVGVIAPWNFPLNLSLNPLVSIFAAGNAAMVKTSELSRRFAEVMIRTAPKYFPAEKLAWFDDDGTLGPAFSALPFDHLLFTGSGRVGRKVMEAAARNLTPVTLELGGKSPAVIAPDYSLADAARKILWAKMFNAGQVCVNVDYVFTPEGKAREFLEIARKLVGARYPDLNGPDYTSIVDERNFSRLEALVEDARKKGAEIFPLAPNQRPDRALRKFPPVAILGATDEMEVMRQEIFGPVLPVLAYKPRSGVVEWVNARERPLALYVFTKDRGFRDFLVDRVVSGGVAVNDAMLQFAQADLPLGGVGASGIGQYQAREGFETFSKLRPIFEQGPATPLQWLFQPPYAGFGQRLLDLLVRLKR